MTWTCVQFVAGIALLVGGAELLVRGAVRLASAVGVSPLAIGLTVVAFATGSPELVVSLKAAAAGESDLVLGNIIGSNICNTLLILGLSALIVPLIVSRQLVRWDVPLMIGATGLLFVLALDGSLGAVDGVLFLAGLAAYLGFSLYYEMKRESPDEREEFEHEFEVQVKGPTAVGINLVLVAAGLGLLVWGGHWLVVSATQFAEMLGVSQLVIGLTVVAVGTSLPEVATSLVAALRGKRDIAVGNAVGSNIFNILAVLGAASLTAADGVHVGSSVLTFDLPVLLATAVACLPVFFTGYSIARWEGALFLGYYVAYLVYIVLHATHHGALPWFNLAMLAFVIPLTVLTLAVVLLRALRHERRGG